MAGKLAVAPLRIHRADIQSKVFSALKIGPELELWLLVDALQFGAPPHGGTAFGLIRIVTIIPWAAHYADGCATHGAAFRQRNSGLP